MSIVWVLQRRRLSRKLWPFLIGSEDAQSQTVNVETVSVNIYLSAIKVHSSVDCMMNQVSKGTGRHSAGSDGDSFWNDRHVRKKKKSQNIQTLIKFHFIKASLLNELDVRASSRRLYRISRGEIG